MYRDGALLVFLGKDWHERGQAHKNECTLLFSIAFYFTFLSPLRV